MGVSDIFYFFLLGGGSPRRQEGGGGMPEGWISGGGGGSSRRKEAEEGVCGEFRGGGLNIFLRGLDSHQEKFDTQVATMLYAMQPG